MADLETTGQQIQRSFTENDRLAVKAGIGKPWAHQVSLNDGKMSVSVGRTWPSGWAKPMAYVFSNDGDTVETIISRVKDVERQ